MASTGHQRIFVIEKKQLFLEQNHLYPQEIVCRLYSSNEY